MLQSYPLYPKYENLIRVHFQNSPQIEVLAFVGCGPIPVTLLLFSKLYDIPCIGIGQDSVAVTLAKRCVKHFGLENEISIICGDETSLSKVE
jgi:tRNA1(Val) A37 N6-methylase TrmN6